MADVSIENLTKIYEGQQSIVAVDSFSITIEDGEFITLVGPSGCGKSTILRCISGLESITKGKISIGGTDVTNLPPAKRGISMVFQDYALYPHMSAKKNMAFGLKMSTNLSEEEINKKVQDAADLMDIADLLNKKPSELSGGQQQRVALGRSMVRDPDVFLMDEPLSNLDAELRNRMRTELLRLHSELDTTTIYVTHDQVEAMTMGDRIAVLNHGDVQQIGEPLECYHKPNNTFVSNFIGSPGMNHLTLEKQGDKLLGTDGFEFQLESTENSIPDNKKYILGIRPEDVNLNAGNNKNEYVADITQVELIGGVSHIHLDLHGNEFTVITEGIFNDQIEQLRVHIPENRITIFDYPSKETILTPDIDIYNSSGVYNVH